MTTVAAALDRATRRLSLATPAAWIGGTAADVVQIRDDFLPETVEDLLRRVDWSDPVGKQATVTGTGAADYALPSDFIRVKRDEFTVYESASVRRACVPVTSDGMWTHLQQIGTGAGTRYYRVKGYEGNYEISFYPALETGDSVTVSYVSDKWVIDTGSNESNVFDAETDILLLHRRPIELGVMWRWREAKGLDFQTDWKKYELWVSSMANHANNLQRITFGGVKRFSPWDIPVPDYIPGS